MNLLFLSLTGMFFFMFAFFFYFIEYRRTRRIQKEIFNSLGIKGTVERKSFVFGIGDRYDQSPMSAQLKLKLQQANLKLKPSEYLLISILLFIIIMFFYYYLIDLGFFLSFFLAELTHWLGVKLFFRSRRQRYAELINVQLPEVCRLLGNTIKAGLTIGQGIERISRDIKEPARTEFLRIHQELEMGDEFEEVVERLKERIVSKEVEVFFNTILIQRQVGGNLAEALHLMANTLEERERVGKEIRAVTAEAKSTAFILPFLPFVMLFMMNFVLEGFIRPLFTPFGFILLGICITAQFIAFLLIRKIGKIQV